MKRNPRKVKWTKAYRKLAGKELAEVRVCVWGGIVSVFGRGSKWVGGGGHTRTHGAPPPTPSHTKITPHCVGRDV